MMLRPAFLPETPDMNTEAHFALSSDLISELLMGLRLRGVQYRRVQTGPEFGVGFDTKPGHAHFHYVAVGDVLVRLRDGTLHAPKACSAACMSPRASHQLLYRPMRTLLLLDDLGSARIA